MRDAKRLAAVRLLPCVKCGQSPSQAAHSNSAKHGKGRGIKASDAFVIPLCATCHAAFDRFELGNRAESEVMFDRMYEKTNRMMQIEDREVF